MTNSQFFYYHDYGTGTYWTRITVISNKISCFSLTTSGTLQNKYSKGQPNNNEAENLPPVHFGFLISKIWKVWTTASTERGIRNARYNIMEVSVTFIRNFKDVDCVIGGNWEIGNTLNWNSEEVALGSSPQSGTPLHPLNIFCYTRNPQRSEWRIGAVRMCFNLSWEMTVIERMALHWYVGLPLCQHSTARHRVLLVWKSLHNFWAILCSYLSELWKVQHSSF